MWLLEGIGSTNEEAILSACIEVKLITCLRNTRQEVCRSQQPRQDEKLSFNSQGWQYSLALNEFQ